MGVPALLPWLSIISLFVAAIVLRHFLAANTDVSWLLTVGERVLDGRRLYIDVVETNPPMAVLVYIPGVAISLVRHIARPRAAGRNCDRQSDVRRYIHFARDRCAHPQKIIGS